MLALVVDLAGRSMVYPLREDVLEVRAGSLSANAICLPFKGVSRRHFVLCRSEKGWILRDLGSTNGVLLNGERVQEAPIREEGKPLEWISKRLLARLAGYDYPGNVRELANLARSMVALAHPGEMLDVHLLPEKMASAADERGASAEARLEEGPIRLREELDGLARRLVTRALELSPDNMAAAARRLDLTPFGLRKMAKRLGCTSGNPPDVDGG